MNFKQLLLMNLVDRTFSIGTNCVNCGSLFKHNNPNVYDIVVLMNYTVEKKSSYSYYSICIDCGHKTTVILTIDTIHDWYNKWAKTQQTFIPKSNTKETLPGRVRVRMIE